MKRLITALAASTIVLTVSACDSGAGDEIEAASNNSIAGTWRADPETALAENSDSSFLLADGQYTCNSCIPPFSTAANGEWQQVDRPGTDELMVEVVDNNTAKFAFRFEGRDLGNSTWTVSEDGETMTREFVNLDGDETTEGSMTLTRQAPGPDGAHAISGEWALGEYGDISDSALMTTYALDGETLSATYNGGGWTATIGGDAVPVEGDESGGVISVERLSDNSYRETYSRDGEIIGVTDITIEGDRMMVVSNDPRDDSVFRYTAMRQ